MEPLFYLMAILGCGDDNAQCRELRLAPVRYRSALECRAAIPVVLQNSTDVPYPVIAAECRASGQRLAWAGSRPRG